MELFMALNCSQAKCDVLQQANDDKGGPGRGEKGAGRGGVGAWGVGGGV